MRARTAVSDLITHFYRKPCNLTVQHLSRSRAVNLSKMLIINRAEINTMTTATNTKFDFNTSHLIEGGIALFTLGITIGMLVAAGMASAVVVGGIAAVASYMIIKR